MIEDNFKFDLFVSFYPEKNPHRIAEYQRCIISNADSRFIRVIHVAFESEFSVSTEQICLAYPFLDIDKISIHQFIRKQKRSISYLDLIKLANEQVGTKQRFIIANTDIFFDDTLGLLQNFDFSQAVLALTRYNVEPYRNIAGGVWERHFASQDCWIFETPFPEQIEFDINLGWHGCDSRIAYELDKAGYRVLNVSKSITSWHVHAQTQQHILEEKYSYRHSGKPYKWLPFLSLDEISTPDFKYETLNAIDRKTIEWMLKMYKSELIVGKRYTEVTGISESQNDRKTFSSYSLIGRSVKWIARSSQKSGMRWVAKLFKRIGVSLSKLGYDLQHIDN